MLKMPMLGICVRKDVDGEGVKDDEGVKDVGDEGLKMLMV